jgi:hypothetical protein
MYTGSVRDSHLKCVVIRVYTGADSRGGAPPLKLEKNMIFWRKIVIFHTQYPKIFHASLRSAQFFYIHPSPNLKSWNRP